MTMDNTSIDFSKVDDKEIEFDFSKLRGRIKEIYGTQTAFALAMLMNEATLSNKLNNNVEFSPKEIIRACFLLCINLKEVDIYFFTFKVQKNELKWWRHDKREEVIICGLRKNTKKANRNICRARKSKCKSKNRKEVRTNEKR